MRQPLTNSRDEEVILYDETSLISIDSQRADGYVKLLSPSKAGSKKEDRENAYMLGFLALTEGNVVDACFGLQNYSKDKNDHKGAAFSRQAKQLLVEATDASEAVEKTAVDSYREAFTIVLETQQKIKKIHFLLRCFFAGKIQRRAKKSLREAFKRLEEIIHAST